MSAPVSTLAGRPKAGVGLTADVFEWEPGRVLKLYQDGRPRGKAEREYLITRAVRAAGVSAPEAFEVIEVEGRTGIVFERIDGASMLAEVERRPWILFRTARQFAELHAQMHSERAPKSLPPQREQIERWIAATATNLRPEELKAARNLLENCSAGDAICHGDFHPENILMSPRGPVIIDWSTGARGNPLADVARTHSLFQWGELPDRVAWPLRLMFAFSRNLLRQLYLHRYFQLRGGSKKDIAAWDPVQVVGRAAWEKHRIN